MAELLYLSDADIEACSIGMAEVIQIMLETYRCKGGGGVQMPPKPGVHPSSNSHLHAMPAYISEPRAAGIKWIGTFPDNMAKGLPSISGLIVLNDPETGQPLCIMDCRRITAMRTGAKTALAARYLARKGCQSLGIIGCGVQGRSNLDALLCEFKFEAVRVFDTNEQAAQRFVEDTSSTGVEVVKTPEDAVRDMDIVVTTRPINLNPQPIIPLEWLKPGGFYAPVDYDASFCGDALRAMDLFVTDDIAQFEYHRAKGYFRNVHPSQSISDLGSIVASNKPVRSSDADMTMAMCLGLGMDDVAVASILYRLAIGIGVGTLLRH